MNNVTLFGRLTRDPESRQVGENTACRFTVAVNRSFKNKEGKYDADFIPCTAFGKNAEFASTYFHKGDPIGVVGEIRTGSYVNKDGVTVYTTEVSVNHIEFGAGKSDGGTTTKVPANTARAAAPRGGSRQPVIANIPDDIDEEMPFN